MTDINETLTELRGTLALSAEERSHMRANLERLSNEVRATPLPSPYFSYFMRPAPAFAFALALLLVVGGTASASANGALPGDALYPLKVNVNERVERALALSSEDKAYVDVRHAEERLSEIELLAAKGSVNQEVATEAATKVMSAIDAANSTVGSLEEGGDEGGAGDLRAHIASALLAHADILDAQAEQLPDAAQQTLRALSVAAAVSADDASDEDEREIAREDSENPAATADREESAKSRITALTKAIAAADMIPDETRDELMAELASIQNGLADAEAMSADGDYRSAEDEYTTLERRAYRALAALTVAERISDRTGKEVVLTIDSGGDDDAAATVPTLMKAAALAPQATTERSHRHERPLQFFLRDREDNSGKGSSDD